MVPLPAMPGLKKKIKLQNNLNVPLTGNEKAGKGAMLGASFIFILHPSLPLGIFYTLLYCFKGIFMIIFDFIRASIQMDSSFRSGFQSPLLTRGTCRAEIFPEMSEGWICPVS